MKDENVRNWIVKSDFDRFQFWFPIQNFNFVRYIDDYRKGNLIFLPYVDFFSCMGYSVRFSRNLMGQKSKSILIYTPNMGLVEQGGCERLFLRNLQLVYGVIVVNVTLPA